MRTAAFTKYLLDACHLFSRWPIVYETLRLFLERLVQGLQADTAAGLPKEHQGVGMLLPRVARHRIGAVCLPGLH